MPSVTTPRKTQIVDIMSTDFPLMRSPNYSIAQMHSTFTSYPMCRGYWPMSSVDESGNLSDMSAQGRVLVRNGTPTFAFRKNLAAYSAIGFIDKDYFQRMDDGGLDFACPSGLVAAAIDGFTLMCWFCADAAAQGTQRGLISKWYETGNIRGYRLILTAANKLQLDVSSNGTLVTSVTSSGTVAAGTWYFACGRYTASTEMIVYLSGTETSNVVGIPASPYNTTEPFEVGRTNRGDGYVGYMGPVAAYAVSMTDPAIAVAYHSTRFLYGA